MRRFLAAFTRPLRIVAAVLAAFAAGAAQADVTIGISLPLTGPASGLGIPMANYIKLWPKEIAGEKLNVIVLDDATDPTKGVNNARRFVKPPKPLRASCVSSDEGCRTTPP